jgi:predicted NBD/HSP70 family sugar kinase
MVKKINQINIVRVLREILFNKSISRVEISKNLGIVKSTVTKIVSTLLEYNIVRIVNEGKSGPSGGRRPVNLMINNEYGYILGLEIQTETYTAVAINLLGEILFIQSENILLSEDNIITGFIEIIRRLNKKMQETGLMLIGIGIGLSGIINSEDGIIIQSNPLNITGSINFYEEISNFFNVPVIIENDANCCCLGEMAFKKNKRYRNFIFVLTEFRKGRTSDSDYWGIAIGLGLVLNRKVYCGEGFSSGEFQSILWEPGNKGQFSINDNNARKIKNDKEVLLKVTRELSSHIAFLVNTLNLNHVVIGGEIDILKDYIMDILREEIQRNWSYPNEVDCTIEFSLHGERAVAYGAACMFLEHYFSIPDVIDSPKQTKISTIGILQDIEKKG